MGLSYERLGDRRLTHVTAVARTGSFSRAAAAVGVTQSAITKSVADLERQLGLQLFERTARGALPTEEGREFLDRAARVLSDFSDLFDDRDGARNPFQGKVRIGAFPASLEFRLTRPIAKLVQDYPGARIDLSTGTMERGVQMLLRGDIDVALGMEFGFKRGEFSCRRVGQLDAVPFVRIGHPLLLEPMLTVDRLTQFPFVTPSSSEPLSVPIYELFNRHGIDWRDQLHIVDFFPLACSIVQNSDAIGVVARDGAKTRSFAQRFVALDHMEVFSSTALCCAVRAQWRPRPLVRAVIAALSADGDLRFT